MADINSLNQPTYDFGILNRSENEQKYFQLVPEPPEFPLVTIKGPVPWKCNIQLAKNRLHEVLMNTHPMLQAISMLWDQL